MNLRYLSFVAAWLVLMQSTSNAQVVADEEIRNILRERVDDRKQSVGIVVGVLEPQGTRVIAYGKLENNDSRTLNGDTVFEIGSMGKVFTALLLADMAHKGEVKLDDSIAKYLPATVKAPKPNEKSITLIDLATHTSGLPRLPTNLSPRDPANPYADYTVKQLYDFLSSYELTRDIGSSYEYSNLGAGLLGHILALRAATDYESLVKSRISVPLGMASTTISLPPALSARLAVGHDASLQRVANWDMPTLAGAGALRSTVNDMLKFLAANLGYGKSEVSEAMVAMLHVRRPTGDANSKVALGWQVLKTNKGEIVWHNGGTGGYRSIMSMDLRMKTGVVVLSNAAIGVEDIAHHLVDPSVPLTPAPRQHKEVSVDPKLFDKYVGQYEILPKYIFTVTLEGNRLMGQATGTAKGQLFPEGEREFFSKLADMQFLFLTDQAGKATQVTIRQQGRDTVARRLDVPVPERKEVAIAIEMLDRYVGQYQLAPNFVLTVTRSGNELAVQATGQSSVPVYATSEKEFFYKVVDAQITFNVDASGKTTGLVLHQNGRDVPAKRIE